MRKLIENYRITPGDHCGSASMRGLLAFYCGLELPEPVVFGLGAGLASFFIDRREDPGPGIKVMLAGRTATLELDLGRHLGVDYREKTEEDDDEAWRLVREEVIAGHPTMLAGDIFYLDYRDYKVNFPSHRFVLVGFDDEAEQVFIADRIRDVPETCSLGAVRTSRNAPTPMSDQNRWGRFHDTNVGNALRDAAESAIRQCAQDMLDPSETESAARAAGAVLGIGANRAYAEALPTLADHDDALAIASFNAPCIEKFGNGGGNFRRLYAGFLEWARDLDPKLVPAGAPARCTESADAWTAASAALFLATEAPNDPKHWSDAGAHVARAAEIEEALFTSLAETVG